MVQKLYSAEFYKSQGFDCPQWRKPNAKPCMISSVEAPLKEAEKTMQAAQMKCNKTATAAGGGEDNVEAMMNCCAYPAYTKFFTAAKKSITDAGCSCTNPHLAGACGGGEEQKTAMAAMGKMCDVQKTFADKPCGDNDAAVAPMAKLNKMTFTKCSEIKAICKEIPAFLNPCKTTCGLCPTQAPEQSGSGAAMTVVALMTSLIAYVF